MSNIRPAAFTVLCICLQSRSTGDLLQFLFLSLVMASFNYVTPAHQGSYCKHDDVMAPCAQSPQKAHMLGWLVMTEWRQMKPSTLPLCMSEICWENYLSCHQATVHQYYKYCIVVFELPALAGSNNLGLIPIQLSSSSGAVLMRYALHPAVAMQ